MGGGKKIAEVIGQKLREAAASGSNVASAVNVGKKGARTSVSSRQEVVHKDGQTTVTTERIERREA